MAKSITIAFHVTNASSYRALPQSIDYHLAFGMSLTHELPSHLKRCSTAATHVLNESDQQCKRSVPRNQAGRSTMPFLFLIVPGRLNHSYMVFSREYESSSLTTSGTHPMNDVCLGFTRVVFDFAKDLNMSIDWTGSSCI